jgi:CRP-like cAMP-binding protein
VGAAQTDVLKRVPLFSELRRKELQKVAAAMTARAFRAGETITKEGEISVGFFVIDEGRARVSTHDRTLDELGPGEYFGEIALVAETPRTATVTAETDLRCFSMTSWDFRALVDSNAEIAWILLASTAKKLYEDRARWE